MADLKDGRDLALVRGLLAFPEDAARVLEQMGGGEYCCVAKSVAALTGVELRRVQQIHRALRTLGFADHGVLHDEDTGAPMGSGYWITPAGERLRDAIEAAQPPGGRHD